MKLLCPKSKEREQNNDGKKNTQKYIHFKMIKIKSISHIKPDINEW